MLINKLNDLEMKSNTQKNIDNMKSHTYKYQIWILKSDIRNICFDRI